MLHPAIESADTGSIHGISLVTNYRGQFAAEIRRSGLDALIQRLESESSALG